MGLKDWKKTRDNKEGVRWENTKNYEDVVFVHTLLLRKGTDYSGARTKTWIGTEFYAGGKWMERKFKSKSQAMAFANKYMRTH